MLRRDSEDHPVVGLTPHFERPLREDVEYYNRNLTHMAPKWIAPLLRVVIRKLLRFFARDCEIRPG
jgi:hypothetical protein